MAGKPWRTADAEIFYRGYRLHLTIRGRSTEISVDPSDHPPIDVEVPRGGADPDTGSTLRFG